MLLTDNLSAVKGIGETNLAKFNSLGIQTVKDLLLYYPKRYEDYSKVLPINKLRPGRVSLKAYIRHAKGRYSRSGLHITEAVASDDSGSVRLIWFNQPY